MSQPGMYQIVFMTDKGDEHVFFKLFHDDMDAAYWGDDYARETKWSLIDVTPHEEKEPLFPQ